MPRILPILTIALTALSQASGSGYIDIPQPKFEFIEVCPLYLGTPTRIHDILLNITRDCREQYLLSAIAFYESTFDPVVENNRSSASGLLGYLDSTWLSHGCSTIDNKHDPVLQLRCGLNDIRTGYGKQWSTYKVVNRNKYGYKL